MKVRSWFRCAPALAALLSMAACAGPGGRGDPKTAAGVDASVAAVHAFAQICGRLNRAAVMSEAARYGFFTPTPAALPADVVRELAGRNATMLVRPQSNGPSLLFWEEVPHCELTPAGVDPAAVEAEFDRMLRTLGSAAGITLIRATPQQMARMEPNGPLRPRLMAVATPDALTPGTGRTFTLLTGSLNDGSPRVSMISRGLAPAASTPSATRPQPQAKEF